MVFTRRVSVLFALLLWLREACAAEAEEPRFTDVSILATTKRLIIGEFFPQAESQLLFASRGDKSPYIVLQAMDEHELMVESITRKKLCEQYLLEECFMNGNVRLPILDKDHHLVGLYSFLFPIKKHYCEVVFYVLPHCRGRGYMPEAMQEINKLVLNYIEKTTYWSKQQSLDDWDKLRQLSAQQFNDQFDAFYQFKPKMLKGIYAEVLLSNKSSLIANLKANMVPSKPIDGDTWWGEICFYFPARQEDPILTEIVRRIAYSTCTQVEEESVILAVRQIKTFSFISPEISDKAICLLELENLKQNVSTLNRVPLSLLTVYRTIMSSI
jgi:hypothetical protein